MIGDDQVIVSFYTWSSNSAVHTSIIVKPNGRTVIITLCIHISTYKIYNTEAVGRGRVQVKNFNDIFFFFTILYSYNIITTMRRPWCGTQMEQIAWKTSIPARLFRLGNDQ